MAKLIREFEGSVRQVRSGLSVFNLVEQREVEFNAFFNAVNDSLAVALAHVESFVDVVNPMLEQFSAAEQKDKSFEVWTKAWASKAGAVFRLDEQETIGNNTVFLQKFRAAKIEPQKLDACARFVRRLGVESVCKVMIEDEEPTRTFFPQMPGVHGEINSPEAEKWQEAVWAIINKEAATFANARVALQEMPAMPPDDLDASSLVGAQDAVTLIKAAVSSQVNSAKALLSWTSRKEEGQLVPEGFGALMKDLAAANVKLETLYDGNLAFHRLVESNLQAKASGDGIDSKVARMLLPFLQQREEIGKKAKFVHRALLQAAVDSVNSVLKSAVGALEQSFPPNWRAYAMPGARDEKWCKEKAFY